MDGQPQPKKRKWDVPGPAAALPQTTAALTVLGAGVGGLATVGQPAPAAPAVDIALAQAAAAALFSKYHPGAQVKAPSAPSPSAGVGAPSGSSTADTKPGDLSREVFINDAPTGVRIHLTKRGVQDEIQARTSTIIVTRGRYYPPGAVPDGKEKPLHLLVKPGLHAGATDEQRQQAVSNAVSDIQRILQGMPPARPQYGNTAPAPTGPHTTQPPPTGAPPHHHHHHAPPPPYASPPYGAPPPPYSYPPSGVGHAAAPPAGAQNYPAAAPPPAPAVAAPVPGGANSGTGSSSSLTCTMYTGIAQPGMFPVAEKIKGPGGSFIQHIASTTGATVQLRGRGSGDAEGPDPLHVFIIAPAGGGATKALEDAKSLVLDLLRTVAEDFKRANPSLVQTVQAPVVVQPGTHAAPPPYTGAPPAFPPTYGAPGAPPPGTPYYPPTGQPYYPAPGYPPPQTYGSAVPPYVAPPPAAYPGAPPPYSYPGGATAPGAPPQAVPPYHYAPPGAPPPYGALPTAQPYLASQQPAAALAYRAPPNAAAPGPAAPPNAATAAAAPSVHAPYTAPPPAAAAVPPRVAVPQGSLAASSVSPLGGTNTYNTADNGGPPKRKFREAREGEQARPSPPPPDNPYAQYAQTMGRGNNASTNAIVGTSSKSNNNNTASGGGAGGGSTVGSGPSEPAVTGGRSFGTAGAAIPAPDTVTAPGGGAGATDRESASAAQVTGSLHGLIGYGDGDGDD